MQPPPNLVSMAQDWKQVRLGLVLFGLQTYCLQAQLVQLQQQDSSGLIQSQQETSSRLTSEEAKETQEQAQEQVGDILQTEQQFFILYQHLMKVDDIQTSEQAHHLRQFLRDSLLKQAQFIAPRQLSLVNTVVVDGLFRLKGPQEIQLQVSTNSEQDNQTSDFDEQYYQDERDYQKSDIDAPAYGILALVILITLNTETFRRQIIQIIQKSFANANFKCTEVVNKFENFSPPRDTDFTDSTADSGFKNLLQWAHSARFKTLTFF